MSKRISATGVGAGVFTVSDADPETFSLRAMMATVPPAYAVTRPVELTFATDSSRLLHVIARVRTLPFASFRMATACVC
jgi:hypothetical protein